MRTKTSQQAARRQLHIVRIDLGVLRGELKPLHLYARGHGTEEERTAFRSALNHIDQAIKELDSATLFHPTLF